MRAPCKDTTTTMSGLIALPQRPRLDRTSRVSAPHRGCVCPFFFSWCGNCTDGLVSTIDCCLKDLVEREPEDTFYHFASGILAEMKREGDACKVSSIL